MRVLLLGSGGREHALAEAILRSPLCESLICAPGNAGMAALAPCVAIDPSDPVAVVRLAKEQGITFAVVAPDNPLVAGVVDALEAAGIPAFGPTKAAAQLEGSKGFTKDLCREANIPTAAYRRFEDAAEARAYAASLTPPFVIKADGLALGKGVVIPETAAEADAALTGMFEGALGASRREVVIEEFLHGEEISFFVLCDGETALPLASAQDHKRAFDGDKGPNTGGMGAYSPALAFTPALEARTMREIIQPTLDTMRARGMPFKGVLYAGLMLTADGPKLIEYNVRFGDPETQVLIPRLKSDLLAAMLASRNGALKGLTLDWHDDVALTVVMATKGYPGPVAKGSRIRGLESAEAEGAVIYHAGTARDPAGHLVAYGGRVLNVTARGATVRAARDRAYAAAAKIDWPEGYCRSDIGWRALGA